MSDREIPQKWIEMAERQIEDQILTSVDEERYTSGDMTEEIYELAEELWDEDEAKHHPEAPLMTKNGPIIPWPY